MLTELTVSVALPVLLSVITPAGLAAPTAWLANVRLPGDKETVGAMPVPVRGTLCGLPVALSTTEMLALRIPEPVGVKVVPMEHDAPTAIDAAQLLVWE